MVSFCCEIFLLCVARVVLTFFIVGLLFICPSSTSITWERTPHPVRRPAFSSHLLSTAIQSCHPGNVRCLPGGRREVTKISSIVLHDPCDRRNSTQGSRCDPAQRDGQ